MSKGSMRTPTFPMWPVVVALAVVGALIAGMIGLDLVLGQRVSNQTDLIVQNSQQSIVWLDSLRSDAQNLSEVEVTAADAAKLRDHIAATAREYDPIATYEGEHAEWTHLQELLRQLSALPIDDHAARALFADEIDRTVDRLIDINAQAGRATAREIRDATSNATWGDLAAGGLTLGIVAAISIVLIRVLARQRQLVASHVSSLEDHNRDLEAFAGRAAHDLRSPMNPIRGYADLILETAGLPEDAAKMAKRIRTAVDRMARVVDDMLALSTARTPAPGVSSTNEVVNAVIEELAPELHGTDVVTKLAAGRAACGDGTLNQLLRNLIGNAIKFRSRARALRIVVETRDVESMVEITVEDNGIGMDDDDAKHVFEPLYRGRTDREVPGHGLGLAIVERTTRALGGTCELTSAVDRGTRIAVRIPCASGGASRDV